MWRISCLLALMMTLPLAAADAAMTDARGDIHISAERASVEYAAAEIDLLSLLIVSNESHHDFILHVASIEDQTVSDTRPMFAVTFQNAEYDFAALRAGRFEDGWRFYIAVRNASGESGQELDGTVEGDRIHILVPREALRSDLHWVVVSSAVQAQGPADAADGGPVWLRDSMPDEGRGPAVPLLPPEAGETLPSGNGDDRPGLLRERRETASPSSGWVPASLGLLAFLRRGL